MGYIWKVTQINRRQFLRRAAVGGGLVVSPSLAGLMTACAGSGPVTAGPGDGGYGPLQEVGRELALPAGFTSAMLGVEGSLMADGNPTPRAHDGMAAFPLANGNIRLIRNHEDRDDPASATLKGDLATAYDSKGGGGTTSLEIRVAADGSRELIRDFQSLNGTIVNCAGGPAPWGSWLSCEETTAGRQAGWIRDHGYVFEVPVAAEDEVVAVPLKAMGRFVHEAVAVDPASGVVYETEDRTTAGFYRFLPDRPGDLAAGGRLQMLAAAGMPNLDTSCGHQPGTAFPVTWVDIDDPDPPAAETTELAVFQQGQAKGAAVFSRLEGCWHGDGGVYFHATDGGDAGAGQVWFYRPTPPTDGVLLLVFESPGPDVLDSPDNLTVSPRGGIVMCEDGGGEQYLRGLTRDGLVFDLARNAANQREFAGACFSPDGRTLFVNIQGDTQSGGPGNLGMTFAIWGPWERGAL